MLGRRNIPVTMSTPSSTQTSHQVTGACPDTLAPCSSTCSTASTMLSGNALPTGKLSRIQTQFHQANIRNRFMGALSNSGRRSANYVGFYKGIQSAGAAVMWSLDSHKLSFRGEFISNWVLLSASLVCAAPVIFMKIKDHVTVEEDLKGTDETLADVLPQGHPEKTVV